MKTFSYAENDPEFERWTHNLLSTFINSNQLKRVQLNEKPDMLFVTSTALRVNEDILNWNIPLVLIHNEAWSNYWPPCGHEVFKAVIGCSLPFLAFGNFIHFPYYAVHFDKPLWQLLDDRERLLRKPKTKFCCFVTSNDRTGHVDSVLKRIDLFEALNVYKHVDSAGQVKNNVGYLAPTYNFIEWVSDYKFMICLENTRTTVGYITEKPFTPWFAGTVPIYDGACASELNPMAFIRASGPIENVVEAVKAFDAHEPLYELMRHEDLMENIVDKFSLEEFERKFQEIVLDS